MSDAYPIAAELRDALRQKVAHLEKTNAEYVALLTEIRRTLHLWSDASEKHGFSTQHDAERALAKIQVILDRGAT